MTVTAHWYGQGLSTALAGGNIPANTLKVMLTTSSYTPNQATDTYASTPGAFEITGTGYTAGGVALSSMTVANSSNIWTLSAANTSWPTATFNTAYGIIYNTSIGSTYSNYPLVGFVNFGGTQSPVGVTFSINWAGGVVLQLTAS
jgi:hypothetical protein